LGYGNLSNNPALFNGQFNINTNSRLT